MGGLRRASAAILFLLATAGLASAQPFPPTAPGALPRGLVLGLVADEVSFAALDRLQLPYGVRVGNVIPDSPAQRAGLRPEDILLEFDGMPVFSASRLRWLLKAAAGREAVAIQYYRGGERLTTHVDLDVTRSAVRPDSGTNSGSFPAAYLGVSFQPLTAGLREAFSVPDEIGVLIADVHPDSPAASAGLRPGDVIVKMGRRTIHDPSDVHRVVDYFEPGEPIAVELIREGRRQSVSVALGESSKEPQRQQGSDPRAGPEPLFDPAWWEEIEEFAQHWKDFFERWENEPPPDAL